MRRTFLVTERCFRSALLVVVAMVVTGVTPADGQTPIHRYSFNEGATADASDRVIVDSIGGADGVVKGAGATATDTHLAIPGGAQATAAYVDLPDGLISGLTNATFEAWYTMSQPTSWTRVFDFGSREGVAGGVVPDGTNDGGAGADYIFYAPTAFGANENNQRVGVRNNDALFGGSEAGIVDGTYETIIDQGGVNPYTLGDEWHVAVVFDSTGSTDPMQGDGRVSLYLNGELKSAANTRIQLGHLNDVNNWLGRSNWSGDASLNGSFNEFRIYDEALAAAQVRQSASFGPERLIPEPSSLLLFVVTGIGCLIASRRRREA